MPCDPTVVLVLSETEELGVIHLKFLKQFLPAWGLTGQLSRSSYLHTLPLLSGRDFLQTYFTHSVLCCLAQQIPFTVYTFRLSFLPSLSFLHRGELQVMDMPEKEPRYDLF